MSQLFDKIKVGSTKRSTFDLSHDQVTTSDFGYLTPICYRDMVPGDKFTVKPDIFVRLSPLAVPTYGRIKVRYHHFFVPYRICFPHWDAFVCQDPNNNYIPPYFTGENLLEFINEDKAFAPVGTTGAQPRLYYTRVMSNLGLNPKIFQTQDTDFENERIAAFPFLSYYRIWMDWFMDSSIDDHTSKVAMWNEMVKDGGNLDEWLSHLIVTRNACFKKDYFTTAKVSPQSGNASKVGVHTDPQLNPGLADHTGASALYESGTGGKLYRNASGFSTNSTDIVGSFTVEAMRAANSLQRWLEKNNFVGSKLINRIFAHFGVQPTAERLDMAEFLGGSSFDVRIGDVTSTAFEQGNQDYSGLGAQAGKGAGMSQPSSVSYTAKEHGVFMTLMSILPDTSYYQGVSRFWSKGVTGDALDYFNPEFENLGYQEVLNKEVYVPDGSTQYADYLKDGIFGWQPRFAEYKFQQSVLASDFIAGATTPTGFNLDSWHLFRKFSYDSSDPLALNKNFVECNNRANNYDRIFQYTSNEYDHFYFDIHCDVKASRPMDGFTAPSLGENNDGEGKTVSLPYGGTRL